MLGQNVPPLVISAIVHAAFLGAMAFYRVSLRAEPALDALETIIADERAQQEFEQDLSLDTTISESLSVQAGGLVTTTIGSATADPMARTKIEQSEALQDPQIKVTTIADISLPNVGELGIDLGEGEVSGEVGARVEGYGAAMARITQELIRMMRQQPVLVVWVFDSSKSLEDDRKEIRDNFYKIYEELRIATSEETSRRQRFSPLETMVCSLGQDVKKLLPRPSSDIDAIQKAIDQVEDDKTGVENTFTALNRVLDEYAPGATRNDRKLAVIVVTDETGDDDHLLEELIDKSERFRTPIYFLGREAIFGFPFFRIRWQDPEEPRHVVHVRVDRGPETAFPECLQYNGLHDRSWEFASSGFGPYAQVRLAKKSGGIFFLLASAEERAHGSRWWGERKFDDLAMKEYEPLLLARRDYERSRAQSEFRSTIWKVIVTLNPNLDRDLNIRTDRYPMDIPEFEDEGRRQFEKVVRAMSLMKAAITQLERLRPQRALEREPRWRAAYDLCYAQLLSYRVRQFQVLLALDHHAKTNPQPRDEESNHWDIRRVREMLPPDEQQIRATKVNYEELERQRKKAVEMYDFVILEHPRTPWAQRAQFEQRWGYGISFVDDYWNPEWNKPKYTNRVPKF